MADLYGTFESNGLINGQAYHDNHRKDHAGDVHWNDPRLKKITRLRLLSDPGFPVWDISYCHGVLKDGRTCDVVLPDSQLPKKHWYSYLVKLAIKDKVYLKGILDMSAVSKLC